MDEPSCSRCQQLLTRVAELEARIRDLEARLGRNATNSSSNRSPGESLENKAIFHV